MPVATIISAIIGAGATLYGTSMQNDATEKAGRESKALAEITRKDQLAAARRSEALARKSLSMQKEEADLGRAERAEERSYGRLTDRWKRSFDVLNTNQGLLNNLANKFYRRSA